MEKNVNKPHYIKWRSDTTFVVARPKHSWGGKMVSFTQMTDRHYIENSRERERQV